MPLSRQQGMRIPDKTIRNVQRLYLRHGQKTLTERQVRRLVRQAVTMFESYYPWLAREQLEGRYLEIVPRPLDQDP